ARPRAGHLLALARGLGGDAAERDAVARQALAAEARGTGLVDADAADRHAGLPGGRRQRRERPGEIESGDLDVGHPEDGCRRRLGCGLQALERDRPDTAMVEFLDREVGDRDPVALARRAVDGLLLLELGD